MHTIVELCKKMKHTHKERESTISRSSGQVKPLYTLADFRHTDVALNVKNL